MLNHLKHPLQRVYDGYELEDEKAGWFRIWENEIVRLARKAGVADRLGIPSELLKEAKGRKKGRSGKGKPGGRRD